jgi:hypothetical protein
MRDMLDEPTPDDLVEFGLDTLAECACLTHLDIDGFANLELEQEMIDIKSFFPKKFLEQLTTLIAPSYIGDHAGNPVRWLSEDSIYYILECAVNVRHLDISWHIRRNLRADCLKNLSKLETLIICDPCGDEMFDSIDDQVPMLPSMSLCPNLRTVKVGRFSEANADSFGDIGLSRVRDLYIYDFTEEDPVFEAVKALPEIITVHNGYIIHMKH